LAKQSEAKRLWGIKNPDYNKNYYEANKPRLLAHQHAYYQRTKAARKEQAKTYRGKNPDAIRDRRLQRYYGITSADYDLLYDVQGGLCAVCRRPDTSKARRATPEQLAVDHNHDTGEVRGLLCTNCNLALGHLQDDPLRIAALLEYVEQRNG
jgi:5-methylcytosine-specific restriction endonuclease McrA